jgi:hypothetical protein
MPDMSLNGHISQSYKKLASVWYNGTDAILEGEAVCYDVANGTATDANARRHNQVVRPTTTTNLAFAGVAVRDYSAKAGGQFIEIALPGSQGVNIAVGAASTTIGTDLCFTAGSGAAGGRFVRDGIITGRGTARVRRTLAVGVQTASAAAGMSLATDGVTLTHTSATGDNAVLAGDTLVVLSGSNDGSDKEIVVGRYQIASVTNATTVVLATTPAKATLTAAGKIHGYIMRGNPKVQADLLDGPESGGVQFICPSNAGGAQGAAMIGGLTIVGGGVTCGATATATLANSTRYGDRKGFVGTGTLTTNGYVVTVTSGIQGFANNSPTTALATFTIDAAAEFVLLEWTGAAWVLIGTAGATLA